MSLEGVLERLRKGEDLERVLKGEKWQTLEELVAFIFREHGFKTKIHYRFSKDGKRYEIDVVAEGYGKLFLVECKKVRKGFSEGYLKRIVKTHKEKVEKFGRVDAIPLVVTLLDIGISEMESVFVVPIYKLNSFILFM